MVVLFHYTIRYGQIYGYATQPLFAFEPGEFGVQLFFMVSGFVIFLTLDKTVHAVDFIASRFSRLYPAYWVAILVTFTAVSVFSLPGREVSMQAALINLSMLQQWLKVPSVDGVYWTLAIELSFYLVMYVLFITRNLERFNLIAMIWLSVIALSQYLEAHHGIQVHPILKQLLLLEYGNLFIAGTMFYKIFRKPHASAYLILAATLLIEYQLHGNRVILITLYFGIFWAFVMGYLIKFAVKPLVFLGAISYSLYLIHQNVGYIVIRNLEKYDLATPSSIILIPLSVSILFASFMYAFVEKPSLRLMRNAWKNSGTRQYLIDRPVSGDLK
jgi:peptidoglycan/LPS O-acetylase OafA/YrhL